MSSLHIRENGVKSPQMLPVVLLHGWSCHGGFFDRQIEALADETLVIAPDMPGHGKTGDAIDLTIEAAADAVAALLEERRLDKIVLAGWSMGAHVAFALLERHGADRVAALLTEDMTPKVLNDEYWRLGTRNGNNAEHNVEVLAAIRAYWPTVGEKVAEGIFAEGLKPDPALLAYAKREMLAADPALIAPMWASLTEQDFRSLIAKIEIPVHLVSGSRSALYGRDVAEWQAARLKDATIHDFARSGHAPHLEEADAFTDVLRQLSSTR
ncbi:pimeloyl-ACP methyl ester carboxylesterase [Breoghania corrubedonensis]|uniref:Pimeloyl-ACP methyl ester carboxylesterase n=1 Tax=Breoghania corrubedonensis TaxID=665038 RepID=A0A2T5VI04_9HYPH|nr:alpha/beta hydrolase [Breoghania corrubedonensis]PTW63397.1 pimeloyl-ACP methyl ester carboxylesterase [Breoghania corrubedonensis]